jgi:hypothetical protein
LKFLYPPVPGIWKHLDSKNCGVWVFAKTIGFKEPSGLGIFLKLQRTAGFQERTNKDTVFLGGIFDFFKNLRIVIRCNNRVFLFFDSYNYISKPSIFLIPMIISFDTQ